MKVDVLVVGSGISGAAAAVAAARGGASVAVVRRGYGATAMASGGVKLELSNPAAAAEITPLLTEMLPLTVLEQRGQFLTALGRVVEADAVFERMARGELAAMKQAGQKLVVVGIKGLNEVRAEPIARAARAAGLEVDVVEVAFPEAKHGHDLTTPELARLCDDIGPAEKLAKVLVKECEGYDRIALPPVLGLVKWAEVGELLDEALGPRWFEVVAALPSVPGMRIQAALDDRLISEKIAIIHGPINGWAEAGGRITGVRAGIAEGERLISMKQLVLATGGMVGRGLRVEGDAVREALLGLHVDYGEVPEPTPEGEAPKELDARLLVDTELRPVDEAGAPAFSNVRSAGELTGMSFGSGRGGLAIGLATGWAAGELAAMASKVSAFDESGEWHEAAVIEDEPLGCINCGLCLSRCPTIRALTREKQSYPGPRSMMSGLTRFESELEDVADELSYCTLCGACSIVCPAAVPVPENITRARKLLGTRSPEVGPQAYQALRNAFDVPKKLFEAEPIEGPKKEQADCVLFIGCSLPYYEREHADATVKLLTALGVDFTMIDEVCCGGPLEVIGAEGADAMAEHNVAEMRRVGAKRVITCCPRCAETMATTAAYAEFEIEHTTTLLARLLPGTELAKNLREKVGGTQVTFHDPCERARLAGEVEAAREVMQAVGLDLVEMPRSGTFTECCGAGGGVRAAQTKTSIRMARLRVADAVATGAPQLLTECPSCLHNLYNGRKRKQKIEISNLSSYLGSQLD